MNNKKSHKQPDIYQVATRANISSCPEGDQIYRKSSYILKTVKETEIPINVWGNQE